MALTSGLCHRQCSGLFRASHSLQGNITPVTLVRNHIVHAAPRLASPARRMRGACRAGGDSTDGEDSAESLFKRELAKRGLTGGAVKADEREDSDAKPSLPQFRGQSDGFTGGQLERSRKLNSEGLEGLIPRATELAKLGGSFWVSFYPFIGLVIAAFIVLYLFSGSTFIHQGNSRMQVPEYLDRSLFADEPQPQQTEAEAPMQDTSRTSASDAVF